jgi:hypothetical protein
LLRGLVTLPPGLKQTGVKATLEAMEEHKASGREDAEVAVGVSTAHELVSAYNAFKLLGPVRNYKTGETLRPHPDYLSFIDVPYLLDKDKTPEELAAIERLASASLKEPKQEEKP